MKQKVKIYSYKTLRNVAVRLRDDLLTSDVVLLFAFNRTGKTRLSMEFKDFEKKKSGQADTLYFNAFTEDLFTWNNDLKNDTTRFLKINEQSKFIKGIKGLSVEEKIREHLSAYADFGFMIDYNDWKITFNRNVPNPKYNNRNPQNAEAEFINQDNIKISRGEERIFLFSIFLAICELIVEGAPEYKWVKYIYIDDPMSSLDENNALNISVDIFNLIKSDVEKNAGRHQYIISTHHGLFYNALYNDLKRGKINKNIYFMHKTKSGIYKLQANDDSPFFEHIADLCELKRCVELFKKDEQPRKDILQSDVLKTHHFNTLRRIFEKTAMFFGQDDPSYCIKGLKDEVLFNRAVNIMSHGKYSVFAPKGMIRENAELFVTIFDEFIKKFKFELPDILYKD